MDITNEALLRHEVESLKAMLSFETERSAHLTAEVARLHEALNQASLALNEASAMHRAAQQVKVERDLLQTQLETQLVEVNRVLYEQRIQFRAIVDVLASQRDWVREWAMKCQENERLQDLLSRREAGTEAADLRRHLQEARTKLAELSVSFKQREVISAVFDTKVRSLRLENERLTADNTRLKEQTRRFWKRMSASPARELNKPSPQ